jgi:Zn ribbon nucleic-acid-binding protein
MIECSTATPWGYHPELRGDRCGRCGFVAREGEDSVEHHVEPEPASFDGMPLAA